jgi:hypothetical protein
MVIRAQPRGRLTSADHDLLTTFLQITLDRYKHDAIDRSQAVADIAHLVAAVDLPDGDDWNAYMRAIIGREDPND